MTRTDCENAYFDWLCRQVGDNAKPHTRTVPWYLTHRQLLRRLHDTSFRYSVPMDRNREADGCDLRYRFGAEMGMDQMIVATYLDDKPCSVLEMMTALCCRCEDYIMSNDEIGDRTGQWFRAMLGSMNVLQLDDEHYDERYLDAAVERMLSRAYESNGKGGLFTLLSPREDLRKVEIWYQLMWYLSERPDD